MSEILFAETTKVRIEVTEMAISVAKVILKCSPLTFISQIE